MSCQTVNHLARDHIEVRTVLDAFERFLDQSATDHAPDRHSLWGLIDALTESLLLRHEEKEETVLLPQLSRMGLSWTDGTLAHVRGDHRHGRYLIRNLRQAAHQLKDWSGEDRRHFLAIGRTWVEFLRHHMEQEEAILFPYLDAHFDADQDAEVLRQFQNIDADFDRMADSADLASSKEEFVQKYGHASP